MKVLAVVVTRNRLALLKECLDSISNQTRLADEVLVVDNESTDGTKEYLEERVDLVHIFQQNLGGAGGFYSGMKYGLENGFDCVWMMDDDGIADQKELEVLLAGMCEYNLDWANAMVVCKDNPNLWAGNIPLSEYLAHEEKILYNMVNPFNGTLVSSNLICKIGLIKKEMFIWGDETEYQERAIFYGCRIGTLVEAVHYHPLFKSEWHHIYPLVNRGPLINVPKSDYDSIAFRNQGYIDHKYYKKNWKKHAFYFFSRFKLLKGFTFLYCYWLGWSGNFNVKIHKVLPR